MKEKTIFICEVCGSEYDNVENAQKCEKNHCKCVEIVGSRYVGSTSNYPTSIDVKMENGKTIKFNRDLV